jgi:hypothetical protein
MKGYLPSAEEDRRDTLIALYFAKCLVSIALRRVDGRDTGAFSAEQDESVQFK